MPFTYTSCLQFVFLQVEEEATDKDNKNCSKDGMCGKVRLCLPLVSLWSSNSPLWLSQSSVSEFVRLCLDYHFFRRIFSSCWGTEGMEASRKGDCYLLTGQRRHRLSSVRPSSSPNPSNTQLSSTWSSFTPHQLHPEKLPPIHPQLNKSDKQTHRKLQTHEPEVLNPVLYNHALSRALSKKKWGLYRLDSCKPSSYWQGLRMWPVHEPPLKQSCQEQKAEVNKEISVD